MHEPATVNIYFAGTGFASDVKEEAFPMSRVERTENPSERRGSEQLRQAQRGRQQRDPNPGHTPGKAEGEERDVEEAIERQEG